MKVFQMKLIFVFGPLKKVLKGYIYTGWVLKVMVVFFAGGIHQLMSQGDVCLMFHGN
jgi:uncharacterized membrane protein